MGNEDREGKCGCGESSHHAQGHTESPGCGEPRGKVTPGDWVRDAAAARYGKDGGGGTDLREKQRLVLATLNLRNQ